MASEKDDDRVDYPFEFETSPIHKSYPRQMNALKNDSTDELVLNNLRSLDRGWQAAKEEREREESGEGEGERGHVTNSTSTSLEERSRSKSSVQFLVSV